MWDTTRGRQTVFEGGYRPVVSFDFYVWRGPRLSGHELIQRLLDVDEGRVEEESAFERSERLEAFRRDVMRRYPALEDISDGAASPWAATPVESPYFVALHLQSSATDEQLQFVLGRALYHGLHILDPAVGEVYAPGPERWQVWLRKIGLGRLAGPDRPW